MLLFPRSTSYKDFVFQGKLKISGNMGMAMKLQKFQKKAEAEFEKAKL